MFPRLHENVTCPLPGYEGWTIRVLANPTGAEKDDWTFGSLGRTNCPDCEKLGTRRGKPKAGEADERSYCAPCTEARTRFGRAAVAIFGESQTKGLNFSTPNAAIASFEQEDLPDEFLAWLYLAPSVIWGARTDDLKKRLGLLSPNGS